LASVCFSARNTPVAAEAGVDTVEEFRGRGYAPAVVAAWARAVRQEGRVPLYSTSWDNLASRSVARKLGLVMYGADFSLE
jgi:predicted GNAT family acetyltransferase